MRTAVCIAACSAFVLVLFCVVLQEPTQRSRRVFFSPKRLRKSLVPTMREVPKYKARGRIYTAGSGNYALSLYVRIPNPEIARELYVTEHLFVARGMTFGSHPILQSGYRFRSDSGGWSPLLRGGWVLVRCLVVDH